MSASRDALQGITELHPDATVTSIDGGSAYDLISRKAMLRGLTRVDVGGAALPFVRMCCGSPSEYLWEHEVGIVHRAPQGEGGGQGDAMMPPLFSLGQHEALQDVHHQLTAGEYLFAVLDERHLSRDTARQSRSSVCSCGSTRAFASTQEKRRCGIARE